MCNNQQEQGGCFSKMMVNLKALESHPIPLVRSTKFLQFFPFVLLLSVIFLLGFCPRKRRSKQQKKKLFIRVKTMSSFTEELQELLPSVDPFFPFGDASPANSFDIFTEFQTQNVAMETDECSALFLEGTGIDFRYSSSLPCQQLENLTLYGSNWSYPMEARPSYDCWESVKREKSEFGRGYGDEVFFSHSYDGCDDFNKYMMQRNGFVDETREINNVHTFSDGWMDSPQNSFFDGQIRRACSTGDLQVCRLELNLWM